MALHLCTVKVKLAKFGCPAIAAMSGVMMSATCIHHAGRQKSYSACAQEKLDHRMAAITTAFTSASVAPPTTTATAKSMICTLGRIRQAAMHRKHHQTRLRSHGTVRPDVCRQ